MKKNILTKALCMILAFALCLTVISVPVMADDADISTQRNKIYGLTSQDKYKTDNNGYQTEVESVKGLNMVVIGENLSADSLMYYDRNNYKFSKISEDMLGASFIRVVRNHSIFTDVISTTPVTKIVEGQDPVTADTFEGFSQAGKKGFRINNSLTQRPWYNGAFSAANGEPGYYEFYVSSDCTVVVADNAGYGYPNLDKSLWHESDGKTHQIYNGKTTYYREYKAGSLVQIPNYGIGGKLADNTKVTYEYTDENGNAKTYETTVGANYFVWDDIAIAVKWANPISYDATLKSVTVGGKAADLSAMENNTLNIGVPYGSENLELEVVTNNEFATVSGVPETVSMGDSFEITVTAEAGNAETYVFNIVEQAFDITVEATEEYKALFAEGKYKGNYVFKKANAPTLNTTTANIAYPDKDGIWKNRTYEVKIDGEVYTEGDKATFAYSKAIAIRDAEENKDKTVTLTAKGYDYTDSVISMMVGSAFNSDAHNFGPVGSALRNADFQIMTSRSTSPGRITNHKDAFADPDAAKAWLRVSSNYIMKVSPNKKATVYVVMNQDEAKNHSQFIADDWNYFDAASYFIDGRVDALPAEAIIDEMEVIKNGKGWYMVDPAYELKEAPYSFIKIQYDTGSSTLAMPYHYVWYKTVDANEEVLIPTVGDITHASDQQPPKVFVIKGEHEEWTPTSTDTTLSGISYSVNGVVNSNVELTDEDEYTIDVAYGAEEVVIDAVATEENATVEITQADLAAGVNKAIIKVTAPDSMYTKEYVVNINVLKVPFMNVNCATDSALAPGNIYKLHDAGEELKSTTYTAETPEDGIAKAAEFQAKIDNFNAVNGEGASYGTNLWNGFPYAGTVKTGDVVTSAKLDNPVYISSANDQHPDFITDGDGWVLKSTKGDTPTAENAKSFGKNDEYLTFEVLKPGTMYVVVPNSWGYKGGTDNDYKFLNDYKIAGQSTYYKHFEAGKVTVPAQDTDKYTVGTRQANTIGFVFVFDDESSTDIKSLSYKFNGVTNTISYIRNNTHLAPIEITPDYPYTGDVEVFINPVMEGATVEAIGSLDKGCGSVIARVTSKDGKATKDYTLNFNYVISNDANLKYVKADGENVTFESGRKATIDVPFGGKVPEITYEVNNAKASAVMETAGNVTTITVTAEDGVTTKVYTITFNIDLGSNDATLKTLKYGENEVALEADKYDYAVELPYGSEIPAVTYEVNDENAKAEANTVDGVTTITVTAQDGTVKTYTLTITVKVPSTDAYLKIVKANGETLAFENGRNAVINLPYGANMPEITYEVNDENASAVMETVGNVIKITVTAEDGVTTKVYTITVNFEEPENVATITIATNGQEIFATIGANDKVSLGNTNTAIYEYGTNIEIEAIAAEGQTFMYWKSGDAIVSENVLYGFVTGSERNIEAIFADADAYTIAFRSNGKIVAYGTVVETVPQDPYWAGYVFNGWYDGDDKTDLKAGDAIGEITESVTYRAGYTKSTDIYTVEVFNGENADALVYTKQYNDKIEVTASDVAEKEFAYWMRDGKIVSYNKTYTFYVSADTQLVANYAAEPAETAAVVITLAKPTQIGDSKLAYYAERNVDETYTVIESGILLDTVAEFDVNTAKTKAMAKNTDNAGQFTVRKANVTAEQQWYAKAYVIYQDASGNVGIAYSELVGPDTVK